MNLQELAKNRKTVRKFKKDVPKIEDVIYALNVIREAPSGKNDQPWKFLLISDESKKSQIRAICEKDERKFYERSEGKLKEWLKERGFSWQKAFLSQAPYLLLGFSEKKSPFSRESFWLAIGYLLLALEEKGLATVTYTPSNFIEVSNFVKASKDIRLEVILPIGYPDDEKPKYERKQLKQILLYEEL